MVRKNTAAERRRRAAEHELRIAALRGRPLGPEKGPVEPPVRTTTQLANDGDRHQTKLENLRLEASGDHEAAPVEPQVAKTDEVKQPPKPKKPAGPRKARVVREPRRSKTKGEGFPGGDLGGD